MREEKDIMESKKVILKTDFRERYDHWFDVMDANTRDYKIFHRLTNGGPNRFEAFNMMKEKGINVVPYGIVRDFEGDVDLVVYDEIIFNKDGMPYQRFEPQHRGKGKHLLTKEEAVATKYDHLCTTYQHYFRGYSERQLFIGDKSFLVSYQSDSWQSNYNTEVITVISDDGLERCFDYPLYAIDYVRGVDGKPLALDLNVAPGIPNDVYLTHSPREVCNLIKGWVVKG